MKPTAPDPSRSPQEQPRHERRLQPGRQRQSGQEDLLRPRPVAAAQRVCDVGVDAGGEAEGQHVEVCVDGEAEAGGAQREARVGEQACRAGAIETRGGWY